MSETMIPFSVVIPLYNKEATVARALQSAFNQTVQDFEIIVVNDGSTDNGAAIVEAIGDPRISLIHQKNQGVSAARNRGIAEARYELIAFLDADDEWLPKFLETIRRMADRYPDCGLYATRYLMRSPSGRQQSAILRGIPETFEGIMENYFQIAARSHPPVWTSATCARKSALTQIGGFPVGVTSGEDLITWARIAVKNNIAYSSACCSIYNEYMPSRIPDNDDVVGSGLTELLNIVEADRKFSLRRYCALWHEMRTSSYLRKGMRFKALREIKLSICYSLRFKLLIYSILVFLPNAVVRWLFSYKSRKGGRPNAAAEKIAGCDALTKVIFFMSIYQIGLTSQLYYQAKNMLENHKIKLLGISGEGEQYVGLKKKTVERGINLVEINGLDHRRNFIQLVRSLHSVVEKFQPNIVHVRTNWQLALAVVLKYFYRSHFMILSTIHGYRNYNPQKAIIAKYLIGLSLRMFADKVITPSSFLKNEFSILGDKRVIIPIGVDDEFFDITDIHLSVTGKKNIVFAGAFRKGKNQDMLIRALCRYIKDTGDEDVCMTLPGEGPYRHQCEQLAVQLGINNKVYFPGFLDRKSMLECYLNSQFVIIPSNSETFGHCITEPFVLGRIVITRPVGVALDIIKNGKTGFIFNDEEELISILKKVIRNEALCTEISKSTLLNRDYLRWSNVGHSYSKLLRDMMGGQSKVNIHEFKR